MIESWVLLCQSLQEFFTGKGISVAIEFLFAYVFFDPSIYSILSRVISIQVIE